MKTLSPHRSASSIRPITSLMGATRIEPQLLAELLQECTLLPATLAFGEMLVVRIKVKGRMAFETCDMRSLQIHNIPHGHAVNTLIIDCSGAWIDDLSWVHDVLVMRNRLQAQNVIITGVHRSHQRAILRRLAKADRLLWFTLSQLPWRELLPKV